MLKWAYIHLGFVGTILLSLLIFLGFVFYLAGVAGISISSGTDKAKNTLLIIGILFPLYPIGWLIRDMIQQRKALHSK